VLVGERIPRPSLRSHEERLVDAMPPPRPRAVKCGVKEYHKRAALCGLICSRDPRRALAVPGTDMIETAAMSLPRRKILTLGRRCCRGGDRRTYCARASTGFSCEAGADHHPFGARRFSGRAAAGRRRPPLANVEPAGACAEPSGRRWRGRGPHSRRCRARRLHALYARLFRVRDTARPASQLAT